MAIVSIGSVDRYGYTQEITKLHSSVHKGIIRSADILFSSVAAEGVKYILIKTGDHGPHFHFTFQSFGMKAELYEGGTVSYTGDTDVASVNHSRTSASTDSVEVSHTPSVAPTGGTLLKTYYIVGNATGSNITTGDATLEADMEWMLKPSEDYYIKITALVETDIFVPLFWYGEG